MSSAQICYITVDRRNLGSFARLWWIGKFSPLWWIGDIWYITVDRYLTVLRLDTTRLRIILSLIEFS